MKVNQRAVRIRPAVQADADALLALMRSLEAQFDLLYEPGERPDDPMPIRAQIADFSARPNSLFAVVESDGELVGFLTLDGGRQRRRAKAAYLIMSVRPDHHGTGVGTALLGHAIDWARSVGIGRVELIVLEDNEGGFHLYRKLGFEEEGRLHRYLWIHGEWRNAILMAKLIDPTNLA